MYLYLFANSLSTTNLHHNLASLYIAINRSQKWFYSFGPWREDEEAFLPSGEDFVPLLPQDAFSNCRFTRRRRCRIVVK